MPVAIPFSTKGKYNDGFQHCLKQSVVNNITEAEYDKWTTLGGYNKDSVGDPTAAQIEASIQAAAKLYYSYFGCNIDSYAEQNLPSGSRTAQLLGDFGFEDDEEYQPKDRICSPASDFTRDSSSPAGASCQIFNGAAFPRRLYRDDVNDEAGFLGYGANAPILLNSTTSSAQCELKISSFGIAGANKESAYVVLNGMHFVCDVEGDLTLGGTDASQLKVANFVDIGAGRTYTVRAQVNSLEFWTYP